jgi:hypothetical protein
VPPSGAAISVGVSLWRQSDSLPSDGRFDQDSGSALPWQEAARESVLSNACAARYIEFPNSTRMEGAIADVSRVSLLELWSGEIVLTV